MSSKGATILELDPDLLFDEGGREFINDIQRGWHAKALLSSQAQAQIAKKMQDCRATEFFQPLYGMSSHDFMKMGIEHGFECFDDDEFVNKDLKKYQPDMFFNPKSGTTMITVDGFKKNSLPQGNLIIP